MTGIWSRYVDFWREKESPDALALGRICFGLAVVVNIAEPLLRGTLLELYALPAHGGIFPFHAPTWSLFALFEPTATVVYAVGFAMLFAGICFTLGLFTRLMAVALMVLQMTLVARIGWFGFGADNVFRVFAFLMVLAPVGGAWSLDARWRGRREQVPAWPRRLIIAQITVLYVSTGVIKLGSTWTFVDGWSALYYALNLPYFARFDGSWAAWIYPITQIATFVSRWWEMLFFLLPAALFLRRTPDRGGRLRRWVARHDFRPLVLGLGVVLHLSLAITMDLGMFPWVMLSLYPFFLTPGEAARWLSWAARADGSAPPNDAVQGRHQLPETISMDNRLIESS